MPGVAFPMPVRQLAPMHAHRFAALDRRGGVEQFVEQAENFALLGEQIRAQLAAAVRALLRPSHCASPTER